eukprot:gene4835-3955_t
MAAAAGDGPLITVFVRSGDELHAVDVAAHATARCLARRLPQHVRRGAPALLWQGAELPPSALLSDRGVGQQATLVAAPRAALLVAVPCGAGVYDSVLLVDPTGAGGGAPGVVAVPTGDAAHPVACDRPYLWTDGVEVAAGVVACAPHDAGA